MNPEHSATYKDVLSFILLNNFSAQYTNSIYNLLLNKQSLSSDQITTLKGLISQVLTIQLDTAPTQSQIDSVYIELTT